MQRDMFAVFEGMGERLGFSCERVDKNTLACRGRRVEVILYFNPFDGRFHVDIRVPLEIRVEGEGPPRIAGAEYEVAQKLARLLLGGSITFAQSMEVRPRGDVFGVDIPVESMEDLERALAAARWMDEHLEAYVPAQNAIVVEVDGKPRPLLYLLRALKEVIASARREKQAA